MEVLRDRLSIDAGKASLRASGTAIAEVVGWLEADGPSTILARSPAVAPADLIAALAQGALGDDDAVGPGLVPAKPRHPALAKALSEPAWAAVFPSVPHATRLALVAGLLQIHDFWNASHEAAQQADDLGERAYSPYWHGIAHRREPDAGNAAYWFRRVGRHPVFTALATAAAPVMEEHGESKLSARLISGGAWNAFAMIDLCTGARPGTPDETLARRLQRLEMWLLLEATCAALPAPPP
jgi:hypothetical protein